MEQVSSPGEDVFRPLPQGIKTWGRELLTAHRVNSETQSGVVGIGRSVENMDATTVFVGPNTDVSDTDIFPTELDGERIVYEPVPFEDEDY